MYGKALRISKRLWQEQSSKQPAFKKSLYCRLHQAGRIQRKRIFLKNRCIIVCFRRKEYSGKQNFWKIAVSQLTLGGKNTAEKEKSGKSLYPMLHHKGSQERLGSQESQESQESQKRLESQEKYTRCYFRCQA